jgi:hypothetical protein
MVLITTVLSLCTEVECGFQKPVSPEEENNEKVAGIVAGVEAAAVGTGGTLLTLEAAATAATAAAAAPVVAAAAATAGATAATYYGFDYTLKYLAWNDAAKEQEFKRQFVAHVTKKRHSIVDSTSADCSNQVEQ